MYGSVLEVYLTVKLLGGFNVFWHVENKVAGHQMQVFLKDQQRFHAVLIKFDTLEYVGLDLRENRRKKSMVVFGVLFEKFAATFS